MVNQSELLDFIRDKFRWLVKSEAVKITIGNDGRVNVVEVVPGSGSLRCDEPLPDGMLPFEFGMCKSSLVFDNCGLRSLKGCPRSVQGRFVSLSNNLTNLVGGPTHVSGRFWIKQHKPLESLDGFPDQVVEYAKLDYSGNLPLLRTLNCMDGVILSGPDEDTNRVMAILETYKGRGQQGAIACAAELAAGGFKGNARW
jgi:hypothetical protein